MVGRDRERGREEPAAAWGMKQSQSLFPREVVG